MATKREQYEQDLIKCAGKYVAVSDHTVIACGRSISEVEKKISKLKKSVKRPIIFPLPKNAGGHNSFNVV